MKFDEIKCSKCSREESMAIVHCVDCEHQYCAQCLLEHQIDSTRNSSHKLVSLTSVAAEQTTEVNNNDIMLVKSNQDSRRLSNASSASSTTSHNNEQQQQQQKHAIETLRQLIEMKQDSNNNNNNNVVNNSRILQIENEINKTLEFYEQAVKERKEYLLKEMNTITQYALLNHTQSIGKQLQIQYQLDMKKQALEKELNVDYEMYNQYSKKIEKLRGEEENNERRQSEEEINESISVLGELMCKIELEAKTRLGLIKELNNLLAVNNQIIEKLKNTDPLSAIEFVSNCSAIQTSIRNTFGYIRINHQINQQPTSYQKELSVLCDMSAFAKMSNGSNEYVSNPLSCNSQSSLNTGPLSSNSQSAASLVSGTTESAIVQSPVSSYMRKDNGGVSETIKNVLTNSLGTEAVSHYLTALHQQQQQSSANDSSSQDLINQSVVSETINDQLIQLSAGSTSSNKSSKSVASSSSSMSGSIAATTAATTSKHPLSHLYANFINNNPKLNTFNYLINTASADTDESIPCLGASSINTSPQQVLKQATTTTTTTSTAAAAAAQLQLNRSKMIYHCKFGEFGITDGQFTEPSGVAINTNNDIVVADTNSHRIQIFDKEGNFKFKFGECGKRDGQLLYPNRVSIVKQTGDIVVTERSPTHQIQIYNKYGQFVRKFGANILQHPRGVYVDYKARIVVVECKVMRVIIFDLYGNVLNKFNCSKYLEFPNGVCCSNPTNPGSNQREEIYISDNRAHCIKVFDYNGNFLRQIGGQGITNYPIGVGINSNNEILVADNHNNFNLTVFTQEGKLINALESKVKHAQCFDVGLMDDGSIVLASKDYRIYVYKYTNSLDYLVSNSNSSVSIEKSGGQLFSPSSSTTSLTTSSSIGYELFVDGHNKITDTFESNFNSNSSIFSSFLANNSSDQLISSESNLAQYFATNSCYESTTSSQHSDVEAERANDDDDENNMSNFNHSFSTLLNLSNSQNSSNIASMLNGFF